jgi:hypothetical protein
MNAPPIKERELAHSMILSRDEQKTAICRLAKSGMSEHSIATATRLSVEQVRRVLGAAETAGRG